MMKSMTMGLQCTIGRFQTQSAIWKFSEENQCSKAKGWIDFFLMLNALELKIFFQYGFLKEHKVCINNRFPM